MIIYLIIFIFLMCISVTFRVVVLHPFKTLFYIVLDTYKYFRFHRWNECKYGFITCYIGLFGKGKTLSAVHEIVSLIYEKYNGKRVWCTRRKKWVTQVVQIISNVELKTVPYTKFIALSQLVQITETIEQIDDENDTLTVTIALGDEFSVQLNSRSFKNNIDPLFLNTILTCRHFHMGLIYTAQRFGHVDALLRQVTSSAISCNKVWRVQVLEKYDAWELENASSPAMVQPLKRYGWFIRNKDFNAYDTFATVGNLSKSCKDGDFLSQEEILQLQVGQAMDSGQIMNPSRRYKRHRKKLW